MSRLKEIQHKATNRNTQIPSFANILIIDDQKFDRAQLRRLCKKLDFSVKISEADSLEAMKTAMLHDTFDLIFIDFHLADGSGTEALKIISLDENNFAAATIMVTGDDHSGIAIEALKNGCSDVLMKDTLSIESMRRSSINALQKAKLNNTLEEQTHKTDEIEAILNSFTQQFADEIKPMLFNMMRHVRDLDKARSSDLHFRRSMTEISSSCERLFDFMEDIGDPDRSALSLNEPNDVTEYLAKDV